MWIKAARVRGIAALFAHAAQSLAVGKHDLPRNDEMSELALTYLDKGKRFHVHRGDAIVVRLRENRTTGYCWKVEKPDRDKDILTLKSSDHSLRESPSFGEGGTLTLTYEARTVGVAQIQWKYWQPWEGCKSIVDPFDVTIVVEE